jgi:CubicO group peptidase (beta-lactamase class C family)
LAASAALVASACARGSANGVANAAAASAFGGVSSAAWSAGLSDDEITRLMRLGPVPGMSMAIVQGGDVVTRAFGVRRAGGDAVTADAVTADTVFEAASLTKPVFAYVVQQLVDEKLLDLDRPLADYVPLPNPDDPRGKTITARHVLSHSSGWRNWRNGPNDRLVADFEPGSRFSYSGEGFFFLQRVAERLTGRGVGRLVRERAFQPLGMTRSSFAWRADLEPALASPHSSRGQPFDSYNAKTGKVFATVAQESGRSLEDFTVEDAEKALPRADANAPKLPNWLVPNAAASLMTTARDYAAFLRHLLGPARPTLDRMTRTRVTLNEALDWGLGLGVEKVGDRRLFWHWGDNPGFKNFVVGDAAAGHAMVVFTNGNAGRAVYERVVRASTGGDHPAFVWI